LARERDILERRPFSRKWGESARAPRTRSCRPLAGLLASCLLSAARPAAADDAQELELAKTRFDTGKYDDAARSFEIMLDARATPCSAGPTSGGCRLTDRDLVERARAFYAASLIALGSRDKADAQIELILRDNPAYAPSPAVFPVEVIDRFTVVRAKVRESLEALARERAENARQRELALERARQAERARLATLEQMAGEQRVVERSSRWIAALPFGVGQIQNGDTALGLAFAGGEAAAGITSIATAMLVASYGAIDDPNKSVALPNGTRARVYPPIDELNQSAADAALANRVAFGVWAGLTAIGIAHAQITFVPERVTTQKRALPPRPRQPEVTPSVSIDGAGASVGVVGRF
jgi:tetratricopeptide (TPR) repeat protein